MTNGQSLMRIGKCCSKQRWPKCAHLEDLIQVNVLSFFPFLYLLAMTPILYQCDNIVCVGIYLFVFQQYNLVYDIHFVSIHRSFPYINRSFSF